MTTKAYQARQPVRTLAPGGFTNRVLSTLDGAAMAMQLVRAGGFAQGATTRNQTLVVAASNASAEMKAGADYLCDGVADDVEINAALSALGSVGGTVLLSEGTFTLAAVITITAAGRALRGLGLGPTTLAVVNSGGAPINGPLVQVSSADCELSDLTVDGNKANNGSATSMIGFQVGGARALVRRVRVLNSAGYGLLVLNTAANSVIRDCLVDGAANNGTVLRAPAGQPLVVSGCTVKSSVIGFNCDDGPVILSDCVATGITNQSFYFSTADVVASNCVAESGGAQGYFTSGARTRYVGCRAASCGTYGFHTNGVRTQYIGCQALGITTAQGYAFTTDVAATEAQYVGCSALDSLNGFVQWASVRATYIGCRAINNSGNGFYTSAGEMQIRGCYAATNGYGVYLEGTVSGHTVDGCRVVNSTGHGIRVLAATANTQLTNNYLRDNSLATNSGYNQISMSGSGAFISGNVLRDPALGNRPWGGIVAEADSVNCVLGHNDTFGVGNANQVVDVTSAKTARRIARLALDWTPASDVTSTSGVTLTASTWNEFMLSAQQTFQVTSPASVIEIVVRGSLRFTSGAPLECAIGVNVDNAATPRPLTGEIHENATAYQNALSAPAPVLLTGLSIGAHTVRLQAYPIGAGGTLYLCPASSSISDFLTIQVTEYLN